MAKAKGKMRIDMKNGDTIEIDYETIYKPKLFSGLNSEACFLEFTGTNKKSVFVNKAEISSIILQGKNE